jgi:hypothetical protein
MRKRERPWTRRIVLTLAVVAPASLAAGFWPGWFQATWWHLTRPDEVSWNGLVLRVPRAWYVVEQADELVLARAPRNRHVALVSDAREALDPGRTLPELERELGDRLGLSFSRSELGGQAALAAVLGDRGDGQHRQQWILPAAAVAILYSRPVDEPDLFDELAGCVEPAASAAAPSSARTSGNTGEEP